jgi:L-glutamine-phosphate cytidylyltransferase
VTAIILAAGVGRRLAPLTDTTHKCLLHVGGQSLLRRMLTALEREGIREAVLVVGHCADRVQAAAGHRAGRLQLRYLYNPEFARGSALSLYAARAHLEEPALVMDADVLFPRVFLRRLIDTTSSSALLIDRSFHETGEEVKAFARGARVIALGKKVAPARYDTVGEGIGFFKCGTDAASELVRCLEEAIAESAGESEYEDGLHRLLARRAVGWADVTGLPWTEVDFVEDLSRAEGDLLTRVERLDSADA